MTTTAHTPGPWQFDNYADHVSYFSDASKHKGDYDFRIEFPDDMPEVEAEANARLIAAAPTLLQALGQAQAAIEEATDIMHYEDGLPVTALEGWEIERAYLALCGVLVELDSAIAAAGGQ